MKIVFGSSIGTIFMMVLVKLIGSRSIQLKNSWPTLVLTAIIWGIGGYLIGAYFDVRLRSEFSLTSFLKSHSAYALGYGVIGAAISVPMGIVLGWIVMTWGSSFIGSMFGGVCGAVYGGLLGWLLDRVVKRE